MIIDMSVFLDEKDLQKLIVIGDRILIKPKVPQSKTKKRTCSFHLV